MIEEGTIVAAHAEVFATKDGRTVLVTVRDIVEGADATGHARGVAEERARCKRIVRYEGNNHGAGDDGPQDRAQRMSDSIVAWIENGRPARDWL